MRHLLVLIIFVNISTSSDNIFKKYNVYSSLKSSKGWIRTINKGNIRKYFPSIKKEEIKELKQSLKDSINDTYTSGRLGL